MASLPYSDGTDGIDSLVEYPNQPSRERTNGVWAYTYRYWCDESVANTIAPNGLIPLDGATKTILGNVKYLGVAKVSPTSTPGKVDVTLTYTSRTISLTGGGDRIEQSAEPISLEYDINDESLTSGYSAEQIAAAADGKQTISVGGLKYRYTEYKSSFTWSEANLVNASSIGIGKVGGPSGITGPTTGKWIFRGKSIQDGGRSDVRISEEWDFSPLGWPA